MDAVMYLKEKARMTEAKKEGDCNIKCVICPLSRENNGTDKSCTGIEVAYPEKTVEIVEKWSKEHPRKTYLSDLLEKYPNTPMHDDGVPMYVCPYYFGYVSAPSDGGCDNYENCVRCWNTPMEE